MNAEREQAEVVEQLQRELAVEQLKLHVNALKALNDELTGDSPRAGAISAAVSYIGKAGVARSVAEAGVDDELEKWLRERKAEQALSEAPRGRKRPTDEPF